jgi:hypothetical protein
VASAYEAGPGQDDEVQRMMAARVGLTVRLVADRCGEEPGRCAGRATVTAGSAGFRPLLWPAIPSAAQYKQRRDLG